MERHDGDGYAVVGSTAAPQAGWHLAVQAVQPEMGDDRRTFQPRIDRQRLPPHGPLRAHPLPPVSDLAQQLTLSSTGARTAADGVDAASPHPRRTGGGAVPTGCVSGSTLPLIVAAFSPSPPL